MSRRSGSASNRSRPEPREHNDELTDVWILGIYMTKFGKRPDKDTVDLAAEAAQSALADGGVTMADIGVLAAGNLMGGGLGSARRCRSRSARPASPSTTSRTRARRARRRCARRSWRSRPASATWASRSGSRSSPVRACCPVGAAPADTEWTAAGPLRRGRRGRRTHRHRHDARRLRAGRHGVRPQVRRYQLRAVRRASPRRTTRTRR